MNKRDFEGIKEGLAQAAAFVRGEEVSGVRVHIPAEIDVKALRKELGLTQTAFAEKYGFSAAAVRDWEQGRRMPEQPVRAFLKVIRAEPRIVERVLAANLTPSSSS